MDNTPRTAPEPMSLETSLRDHHDQTARDRLLRNAALLISAGLMTLLFASAMRSF